MSFSDHNPTVRVGVDFDNTIVCYDRLFFRVAREQGLVPADLPPNKGAIRDHLRRIGREDEWTRMQGYVYGARMAEAEMFPGARDCFRQCRAAGIPIFIISHKTRRPYLGPAYDLHQAARDWLEQQGFHDSQLGGLRREDVFLELTKEAKLDRIATQQCTIFLDDLPEFLTFPQFPAATHRILFDPGGTGPAAAGLMRVGGWDEFAALIREQARHA